jgi:hypothetical protein
MDFHPTKILVITTLDGKEVRALIDWGRFDELIQRCNQKFCPGAPVTGPKLPKR